MSHSESGIACAQHCTTETPYERKRRVKHNKLIRKTNAEHYSQRCDFLNRMRVRLSFFPPSTSSLPGPLFCKGLVARPRCRILMHV